MSLEEELLYVRRQLRTLIFQRQTAPLPDADMARYHVLAGRELELMEQAEA